MQEFTMSWIFCTIGSLLLMFGVTIMCINGFNMDLFLLSIGGILIAVIGTLINLAIIKHKKKNNDLTKLN